MAISMTEAAARHIRRSLDGRGKGEGIRLGVRTTGCSGLAFHPLGSQGAGSDCRTTTIGLELGIFNNALLVHLDLQTHDVATRWINIPGVIRFQPSEFLKILMPATIASWLQNILKLQSRLTKQRLSTLLFKC